MEPALARQMAGLVRPVGGMRHFNGATGAGQSGLAAAGIDEYLSGLTTGPLLIDRNCLLIARVGGFFSLRRNWLGRRGIGPATARRWLWRRRDDDFAGL